MMLHPRTSVWSMARNGWCVWITGLPGSGKSATSVALIELLNLKGFPVQLLSSDALRKILTPKPSYSLEERDLVYAALVYVAKLLTENGVNALIDATGNLRRYRDSARQQIPLFFEAYLECPLEVCIQRETSRRETRQAPRQIYIRAKHGEAPTVPGIGQPYEPPPTPEISVDTTRCTPKQAAQMILQKLHEKFL